MNKLKKIIVWILAVALMMPTYSMAASLSDNSAATNAAAEQRLSQIDALFSERQRILMMDTVDQEALHAVEAELEALGVTFMTADEAAEELRSSAAVCGLGVETMSASSSVTSYATYTWDYIYQGESYVFKTVTAQGESFDSPLWTTGSKTAYYDDTWDVAQEDFATLAVQTLTGLSETVEQYVGGVVTAAEMLSTLTDIWSLAQTSSVFVEMGDAMFIWTLATTATFLYVRKASDTSFSSTPSLISTRCYMSLTSTIRSATYRVGIDGDMIALPKTESHDEELNVTPDGYNSPVLAINNYNSGETSATKVAIKYVYIYGFNNMPIERVGSLVPAWEEMCG